MGALVSSRPRRSSIEPSAAPATRFSAVALSDFREETERAAGTGADGGKWATEALLTAANVETTAGTDVGYSGS